MLAFVLHPVQQGTMEFEEAVDTMNNKVKKTLSNEELLALYALYKQATVGDCNTARPGMLDLKGKAKWDAWNAKKGVDKDQAKKEYAEYAEKMVDKHGLQ